MPVIQGVFISTPERRRREHLPTIDLDLRKDPRKARLGGEDLKLQDRTATSNLGARIIRLDAARRKKSA
jgi:hypothetical protein